jgi:putative FmdB family regulatory protein
MPIYEYRCRQCGNQFEVLQRFSDAPVATCRECQGPVDKLISSPAFQFKGTGWYITDYARKSKPAASDSEPKGKAKDSTPSKGETKAPSD